MPHPEVPEKLKKRKNKKERDASSGNDEFHLESKRKKTDHLENEVDKLEGSGNPEGSPDTKKKRKRDKKGKGEGSGEIEVKQESGADALTETESGHSKKKKNKKNKKLNEGVKDSTLVGGIDNNSSDIQEGTAKKKKKHKAEKHMGLENYVKKNVQECEENIKQKKKERKKNANKVNSMDEPVLPNKSVEDATEEGGQKEKRKREKKHKGNECLDNVETTNQTEKKNVTGDGSVPQTTEKNQKRKKGRPNKKKDKKMEKPEEKQTPSQLKSDASIEYLRLWKNNRDQWKFQTVRNVWILKNMYIQCKIKDDDFDIALEYIEKLEGRARKETIKQAEDMMAKCEIKSDDKSAQDDTLHMTIYRVRRVLQILSE